MQEKLETINVGIFGHIDHGKTTLLKQLSGKWADTHSEEIKRGITIKLGYADITLYKEKNTYNIQKGTPVRRISFVDSPGHEMLMATTLSGAALIDVAILVVAANEGIKPQTYEHLMALQAKKVSKIIVVQNKIDLVDKEKAKTNYNEIKKILGVKYADSKIIPVCALQNINMEEVFKVLAEIEVPKKNTSGNPLFIVARSFDINKPGTKPSEMRGAVLGGTLLSGKIKTGEIIEIKPGRIVIKDSRKEYTPLKTKVLTLYRGSVKETELTPGGSMSIETELDMSIAKSDQLAGNLVSTEGALPEASYEIRLRYELFQKVFGISSHVEVEKIKQGEVLMLSINTFVTGGNVTAIKQNEMTINLKVPAIIFKGDNIGIARNIKDHWRLIGYGEVL